MDDAPGEPDRVDDVWDDLVQERRRFLFGFVGWLFLVSGIAVVLVVSPPAAAYVVTAVAALVTYALVRRAGGGRL